MVGFDEEILTPVCISYFTMHSNGANQRRYCANQTAMPWWYANRGSKARLLPCFTRITVVKSLHFLLGHSNISIKNVDNVVV